MESGNTADIILYPEQDKQNTSINFTQPFNALPNVIATFSNVFDPKNRLKYLFIDNIQTTNCELNVQGQDAYKSLVTIDSEIGSKEGIYISTAIINGNPGIAYTEDTAGVLKMKYVRALDPIGKTWGVPVEFSILGDVGALSLSVINGYPAIAYYNKNQKMLKYRRADDENGSSWSLPDETASRLPNTGDFLSLKQVEGKPCISYRFDGSIYHTSDQLKYTIQIYNNFWIQYGVDIGQNIGKYNSLNVIDGKPAISYKYGNTLKYVFSKNTSGSMWHTPISVDNSNAPSTGSHTSLANINGHPAISYQSDGLLKYAVAASSNTGEQTQDWTIVTVDNTPGSGVHSSLSLINGFPAIAYFNSNNGGVLKYAISSTQTGDNSNDWNIITVDKLLNNLYPVSLLQIDNNPFIAYQNFAAALSCAHFNQPAKYSLQWTAFGSIV